MSFHRFSGGQKSLRMATTASVTGGMFFSHHPLIAGIQLRD